jgi:hypothetical protein
MRHKSSSLIKVAAAFLTIFLSSQCHAIYKCGAVYQDLPCPKNSGEKIEVRSDARTERQRWDAEVLRAQNSSTPFLAKYPYIYTLISGQWYRSIHSNGREQVDVVNPYSDPDLANLHATIRKNEISLEIGKSEQKLKDIQAESDRKIEEINKQSADREKKIKALQRDAACRGRSTLDPECSASR